MLHGYCVNLRHFSSDPASDQKILNDSQGQLVGTDFALCLARTFACEDSDDDDYGEHRDGS